VWSETRHHLNAIGLRDAAIADDVWRGSFHVAERAPMHLYAVSGDDRLLSLQPSNNP
jgi:hypothetical protein